jgi:NTP pyrophosphatase (non-canonical NTP hydrolase)
MPVDSWLTNFILLLFVPGRKYFPLANQQIYLNKMTIEQLQQTIDHWIKTTGVRYFNELTNTAVLMEEVGEVARIMARRYGEQSEKESDKNADLADELADVLFVLVCIANQTGIDLTSAMDKNMLKKTLRDKDRHRQNSKLQE